MWSHLPYVVNYHFIQKCFSLYNYSPCVWPAWLNWFFLCHLRMIKSYRRWSARLHLGAYEPTSVGPHKGTTRFCWWETRKAGGMLAGAAAMPYTLQPKKFWRRIGFLVVKENWHLSVILPIPKPKFLMCQVVVCLITRYSSLWFEWVILISLNWPGLLMLSCYTF
jgi:hypothetical protein